ncbi:MAG: glutamine amidotransferase [Calothrix sp. MO_192.B10]|nr:glutamine amidotransferase [Calothrix sp. MO_192.B10]
MKNVTVIRHVKNTAFGHLGSLVKVLNQQNYTVTYLEPTLDNLADVDSLTPDIFVILGGPMRADDEQHYPFLIDELHLLEKRLSADLPTLGICLGAQLMARTLGSKVYRNFDKEMGWAPLELSYEGTQTCLVHLAADQTPVLHWHRDTFELPFGAIHLASSFKCKNQAFSWGKYSLALQFHPEVTIAGLESWVSNHTHEISQTHGVSVEKLRQETIAYSQKFETQATQFWQAWLESVSN